MKANTCFRKEFIKVIVIIQDSVYNIFFSFKTANGQIFIQNKFMNAPLYIYGIEKNLYVSILNSKS